MAPPDPRRLTRRQFDLLGTQLAGAIVAVLLGIPIVGFVLSPLFRREPTYWQQVGNIANLPEAQPTKFVVSFPAGDWTTSKVSAAVYVVKQNSGYTILSNVCSHMQCPVHWDDALHQFICPCHGGIYDISGKNVGGPPPKPLPQYVYRIDGTTLYIENRFTETI